jgi:sporulation protein YlmC with PRC-barrel domain
MEQRTRTGETISGDVPGSAAVPSEQGAAIAGSSYRAGHRGPGPRVMGAATLNGDEVLNRQGEKLGTIEEIMLDVPTGRIAYAVLSCGGFLGIGDKLFAIPFEALELDAEHHRFVLDVPREKLEKAPGFDKNDWPDFADPRFGQEVYGYYDVTAYW